MGFEGQNYETGIYGVPQALQILSKSTKNPRRIWPRIQILASKQGLKYPDNYLGASI
jgi:hypothetical protein